MPTTLAIAAIGLLAATLALLAALGLALRRAYKRTTAKARAANEQVVQGLADCRAAIDALRLVADPAPVQRALAAAAFRASPAAQARLAALGGRRGDEELIYALDRLAGALSPRERVAAAGGATTVCSVALGDDFREAVAPCLDSHERFARRHGYRYCVLEGSAALFAHRPASMKLPLIARLLDEGAQQILFLDADALIADPDRDVEPYFRRLAAADASVLLTENEQGPDAGVLFIRNRGEARRLLELVWLLGPEFGADAAAFALLLEDFPAVRRQLAIEADPRAFNSAPRERDFFRATDARRLWRRGDFICHFADVPLTHLASCVERYARALAPWADGAPPPALRRAPPRPSQDGARGGTVTFSRLGRMGQFGNQLFQIAATLSYAERYGARPLLPPWRCELRARNYGPLFPGFARYRGAAPKSVVYAEPSHAYAEIPYHEHVDLSGFFQTERHFLNVRDTIVELFATPPVIAAELDAFCAAKQLRDFDALHFRSFVHPWLDRGEQEDLPDEYYLAAMRELDGDGPLFVCANHAERAEAFLRRHDVRRPVILSTFADPLLDFYLMSRARRLAISNSSFSWWAAYLGRDKARILAPHRYFWFSAAARRRPDFDMRDLLPAQFQELIL